VLAGAGAGRRCGAGASGDEVSRDARAADHGRDAVVPGLAGAGVFRSVAVASGLIFGLVPALRGSLATSGASIQQGLREGGRGVAGPQRHWFQHSLIVAETALAVVLLTGGGLLLETLRHLRQTDLGLRTDHVLTMATPVGRFKDFNQRIAFVDSVLQKVRAVPGVVNAATTSSIPMTENGGTSSYLLAGKIGAESIRTLFPRGIARLFCDHRREVAGRAFFSNRRFVPPRSRWWLSTRLLPTGIFAGNRRWDAPPVSATFPTRLLVHRCRRGKGGA